MNILSYKAYSNAAGPDQLKNIEQSLQKGSTLQYTYAKVSFSDFSKHYSPEGWFKRKLKVILVAPSAFVGTIVLVACGILLREKSFFFMAGRMISIAGAQFVTLFNDKYGQYIVQNAMFHMDQYEKFSEKDPEDSSAESPSSNNENIESPSNSSSKNESQNDVENPSIKNECRWDEYYINSYNDKYDNKCRGAWIRLIISDCSSLSIDDKFNILKEIAEKHKEEIKDACNTQAFDGPYLKQSWENAIAFFEQFPEKKEALRQAIFN